MAGWDDVERIALSLPLVHEKDAASSFDGWRVWKIQGDKGKQVVWERPLRPSDLRQLAAAGIEPPDGESIAVRTPDLDAKAARLEQMPACFDIPHFARFSGVLVRLDEVDVDDLQELIEESWETVAPRRAVKEWLAARDDA
jgi:hypothetical protein